jgi:PIN domain nuclease of toxin-antitoxin system
MKLLLDTHVWLWSLLEPARLKPAVRAALTGEKNELWLSPISAWEVLVLAERGRLDLEGEPRRWVEQALAATQAKEAALTHEIALASRSVELPHEDPADRFLVATARVLGLQLVTADKKILASKACRLLAA